MRAKITKEGLLIPREVVEQALPGSEEVEIFEEPGRLLIAPAEAPPGRAKEGSGGEEDPMLSMGEDPVDDEVTDASATTTVTFTRVAEGTGRILSGARARSSSIPATCSLERRTDQNHLRSLDHWMSLGEGELPRLVSTTYVFGKTVDYLNARGLHASASRCSLEVPWRKGLKRLVSRSAHPSPPKAPNANYWRQ
ncbi:MAG: hypothetical protein WKF53_09895 [Rubrobacter sp.]